MTSENREALQALLAQMRAIFEELTEVHAGVCVLHLDAAIAALESHLLRSGASVVEERPRSLASSSAMQ